MKWTQHQGNRKRKTEENMDGHCKIRELTSNDCGDRRKWQLGIG